MTRANNEQLKHTPWFAKAGAACSIVPISRFVSSEIFALKGGEYSLRLLLAARTPEQLRDTIPSVHRIFVDARAQVMEETLGKPSVNHNEYKNLASCDLKLRQALGGPCDQSRRLIWCLPS
jgi:hypothetical protein